jgi:hypothetical protein
LKVFVIIVQETRGVHDEGFSGVRAFVISKKKGKSKTKTQVGKSKTKTQVGSSMKRKIKIKPIYDCRCNGRLQTKRFMCLTHIGLVVELGHLKIKTRLTNEKFPSVKGECKI